LEGIIVLVSEIYCGLIVLIDYSDVYEHGQDVIDGFGVVLRPAVTGVQNAIYVAVKGLREAVVLRDRDKLEEEDGLEETDEADVEEEAHEAIVPGLGWTKGIWPGSELICNGASQGLNGW
jgi:hypothetical protein